VCVCVCVCVYIYIYIYVPVFQWTTSYRFSVVIVTGLCVVTC
jgi:hypothetical protein